MRRPDHRREQHSHRMSKRSAESLDQAGVDEAAIARYCRVRSVLPLIVCEQTASERKAPSRAPHFCPILSLQSLSGVGLCGWQAGHTTIDRLAIRNIDSSSIICKALECFRPGSPGKSFTSGRSFGVRRRGWCRILRCHRLSPFFADLLENYELRRTGILRLGIFRNNFKDVRSSFIERLFNSVFQCKR